MTTATLLTAKRGEGKGLTAVAEMQRVMLAGRMVATNIEIRPWLMVGPLNQSRAFRVPDFPTAEALQLLPLGNPGIEWLDGAASPSIKPGFRYSDDQNGLLVLDECSVFLNARRWQGEDRQKLLDWLAHSRKYGWDLLLIAQGMSQVDKQVRDSITELFATVRDMGKIQVPIVSSISRLLFGVGVKFPSFRIMVTRYGFWPGSALADRRIFRGENLHEFYDTLQVIDGDKGQQGVSAYLTGWEMKGRHMSPIKLYGRVGVVGSVVGLIIGAALGWSADRFIPKESGAVASITTAAEFASGVVSDGLGGFQLVLADGRVVKASGSRFSADGMLYEAEGKRYRGPK